MTEMEGSSHPIMVIGALVIVNGRHMNNESRFSRAFSSAKKCSKIDDQFSSFCWIQTKQKQ